jgi:ferritin
MIAKKIEDAINGQINKEMFSAYLYLSMASWAEVSGLKGITTWLKVQYHEEMVHGMKFYEYIIRKGGVVRLAKIDTPENTFDSALSMFEKVLTHEEFISKSINDLMDLAITEKDHATKVLLDWYVNEQVEEEQNVNEIIQTLKMIGDNKAALYLYDKELGARTLTVPSDFSLGVEAQLGAAGAP